MFIVCICAKVRTGKIKQMICVRGRRMSSAFYTPSCIRSTCEIPSPFFNSLGHLHTEKKGLIVNLHMRRSKKTTRRRRYRNLSCCWRSAATSPTTKHATTISSRPSGSKVFHFFNVSLTDRSAQHANYHLLPSFLPFCSFCSFYCSSSRIVLV